MATLIGYYRVSTKQQGSSGLGLEGQRAEVERFAAATGATIARSFTEIESGKRADRPQLAAAIAFAKRSRAKLVIAKLDRLARNVAFLSALMESGVAFVCCDNPNANPLTLHILMAVAEDEAKRIAERTRVALAAAKARGATLGSARPGHWDGREDERLAGLAKGRETSAAIRRERAIDAVADLIPDMRARRDRGESLATIAKSLNAEGQRTARGSEWSAMQVKRVLDRVACP